MTWPTALWSRCLSLQILIPSHEAQPTAWQMAGAQQMFDEKRTWKTHTTGSKACFSSICIRVLYCFLGGCHNKWPQIGSLTDLRSRSLKPRCWQSHAPSTNSMGVSFPASFSFWWLLVFLGLWLHHSHLCVHLHVAFFPVSVLCLCVKFPSLSLIRTLVIGPRTHSKTRTSFWALEHNINNICKAPSSNKVTFASTWG